MAVYQFTGRDLVTWFQEHPSNGQEWQYRVRYQCVNRDVVHYVNHTDFQSHTADDMRVYRDILTFAENLDAGITRSPKVYLATQDAGGKWSDEREIEANNPAPPVPSMSHMNGYDLLTLNFAKPVDSDWAGFVVWADTQFPVRKNAITSKYEGPDNTVQIAVAENTKYYVTYAAYDAFGTDDLNEATVELTTLPKASILLPVLNERLDAISAINVKRSTAFAKLANAYGKQTDRRVQRAVEKLYMDIDNGTLVSGKMLELETKLDDFNSVFTLYQETQAGIDFAQSEQILGMGAKWKADIETALVEERKVYVDANQALTLRLDQQASRIGDNESQFNDKIETLVDQDKALSQRITDQSAVWNSDINGKITAARQVWEQQIADGDSALSQRIETISAQVGEGGWASAIQQANEARAAGDKTNADSITSLTSRFNNQGGVTLEQKLSTYGSAIDGFGASYTLRIDNNGILSGFGLVSDPNGNSEFAINADRLVVGHPGSLEKVFEVVSGQVRMRQAIIDRMRVNSAQIDNLTIGTNQISVNAVTLTHSVQRGSPMYGSGQFQDALVYNLFAPYDCYLTMIVTGSQGFPNGDRLWNIRLFGDGGQIAAAGGQKTADAFAISGFMHVPAGNHEIRLMWQGAVSVTLAELKCTILEMRR